MDVPNFEMNHPTPPQLKNNHPLLKIKPPSKKWKERKNKKNAINAIKYHQGIDEGVCRLLEINFVMLVVQICYNSQWM